MGYTIVNMITFYPELVVLGGGTIKNFPFIVDEIDRTVRNQSLVATYQAMSIKISSLGFNSALIGSALQVINEYFDIR